MEPLAQGYLTRPHEEITATTRGEELAEEKDLTMAQIALSWLLHQDSVDAPLVGTTSVEHLEQAVEALEGDLSESEQEYL